jgi:hypothetical protein
MFFKCFLSIDYLALFAAFNVLTLSYLLVFPLCALANPACPIRFFVSYFRSLSTASNAFVSTVSATWPLPIRRWNAFTGRKRNFFIRRTRPKRKLSVTVSNVVLSLSG